MIKVKIGMIVEGEGEVKAAPVLLRRIADSLDPSQQLEFEVRRIPKTRLLRPCELENAIEALARQIGRSNAILIILDADDTCPRDLAISLRSRCRHAHCDLNISVIIANKEYEAWFLAAAASLARVGLLTKSLERSSECESVRGAKEWLSRHRTSSEPYMPTRHQATFSAALDLSEARLARSFRKLEKEMKEIMNLQGG